jgi:beta-xylosidase
MTFSSFEYCPGLVVGRSLDLVNWRQVTAALNRNSGSVWAPELCKHGERYFLYIPARTDSYHSNYESWADRIEGPWSDPVDLRLPAHIDPGHAVGEDGSRWLFLSGGDRVRLTADGLATAGPVEHVYDPWHYPEDWVVEGFAPEGPKITRHGDYFYLITAVGGTAGPPTGRTDRIRICSYRSAAHSAAAASRIQCQGGRPRRGDSSPRERPRSPPAPAARA